MPKLFAPEVETRVENFPTRGKIVNKNGGTITIRIRNATKGYPEELRNLRQVAGKKDLWEDGTYIYKDCHDGWVELLHLKQNT